jgi:hypothetical protein
MPSRATLLRLAEQLAVPLREQNLLPLAAGYAPLFPERSLDAPELAAVRRARRNPQLRPPVGHPLAETPPEGSV